MPDESNPNVMQLIAPCTPGSKWHCARWHRIFHTALPLGILLISPSATLSEELIDRLMAVVDHQIITLGDVQQELDLQDLDPELSGSLAATAGEKSRLRREMVLQHLIEQTLIHQQVELFPGIEVSDKEVDAQLSQMQRQFTGPGTWEEALAARRVSVEMVRKRIRWQLEVMKFIDYRFRQFVVVDSSEVENYYNNQFLPDLRKRGVQEQPPLDSVSDKIREILVEEKLNVQVEEWLGSLRAAASIEIYH